MATKYIYNGFGGYEKKNGVEGIGLRYAGIEFFLPFGEVTPIPDFTFRELDHDKSTAADGEEAVLTYESLRVSGDRIAWEITDQQIPVKNSEKGIIILNDPEFKDEDGKPLGYTKVASGWDEEGNALVEEVPTARVSPQEKLIAETVAGDYKNQVIQEYFQSKRERMAGGNGRMFPTGIVKVFMAELGVKDLDDVSRMTEKNQGLTAADLLEVIKGLQAAQHPGVSVADLLEFMKQQAAQQKPAAPTVNDLA